MSSPIRPQLDPKSTDQEMFDCLQRETFEYFIQMVSPETGLIADSTQPGSGSSIAAVGMALSSYIVGVERKFISRSEAAERTIRILKFFLKSHQGTEKNATGYKGFYYHFLDMQTGERKGESELSTVDTALLVAGMLSSAQYFQGKEGNEIEIREIAHQLFDRVDWRWACDGKDTLTHGWTPESGFLPYRWDRGLSEAHILYVLALGSNSFPISEKGYQSWISTFRLTTSYGLEYLHAGPLFIHQMSQIWLDLRGKQDDFNRKVGFSYFENTRRATYAQQLYAIENSQNFAHYGENCWGFTASDGPGPARMEVEGRQRVFFPYVARGAPDDLNDGTLSPWAVVTSLPFTPEIVIKTVRHAIEVLNLKNIDRPYGFDSSFNPTFPPNATNPYGWISPWKFGLNQGPVIIMIENYQSGLMWKLTSQSPAITRGLERAGFKCCP
jgi:hypothetical protein